MPHGPKHPSCPAPWLCVLNGPRYEVIDSAGHQLAEVTIRNNSDANGFVLAAGAEWLEFGRRMVKMYEGAVEVHGEDALSDDERELYARARILLFKSEGKSGTPPVPKREEVLV